MKMDKNNKKFIPTGYLYYDCINYWYCWIRGEQE